MTRAKISEYSATAGDNTDVNGTNVAEGCAPSGINNAIREVMAALKRFQTGSDGDAVTVGNDLVVTGDMAVDTDTLVVDATNNRVGIGTASPAGQLHIVGNDTTDQVIIENTDETATTAPDLVLYRNSASPAASDVIGNIIFRGKDSAGNAQDYAQIVGHIEDPTSAAEDGALAFYTYLSGSQGERMRIDSSGNVLIGTTSAAVAIAGTQNLVIGSGVGNNGLSIYAANTGNSNIGFSDTDNNFVGAIQYEHGGNNMTFRTNGGERMRITSSGNVGIGTTSPTVNLEIGSNTSDVRVLSVRYSSVPVYLSNSYNGTSGLATLSLNTYNTSDGSTSWSSFSNTGYASSAIQLTTTTSASDIRFMTASAANTTPSERMRITSAGEVLVGGTTAIEGAPSLAIQSTIAAALSLFRSDTSVTSGDSLGQINFYGNDTTSNTPTRLAYIQAVASGTHAAGDNPTKLVFGCTNDGSETVAEFATLEGGTATRSFSVRQPTLTNTSVSEVYVSGGTAGTINRYASISVYKHSGITNACGYVGFSAEDSSFSYVWADNSDVLRISTNGANVGTTGGTVVGTQTSDERLKDISGPVTYGLNEVLAIEPIAFTMKDDPNIAKIGFSAQQVQPIVPEAVYDTKECIDGYTENEETKEQVPNSDRTKLAMEYTQLIPVLVNAVKELSAKCDALQAEVNTLKGN